MQRPKFIDTHAHIYLPQFEKDISAVVDRALDAGVEKILMPNIDLPSMDSMLALADRFPGVCYPMMGLHPCAVDAGYVVVLEQVEHHLYHGTWAGVGETGIDHHWDRTFDNEQEISFRRHIEWAKDLGLPIVIHSRESLDLNISLVEEMQDGRLKGVFHCFNGTERQAGRIRDAGLMMGLGGVITFKNSGMREVLPHLDLDSVILETDAPYLSPAPFRGERNESSYLLKTAEFLADCLGTGLSEIAMKTTENAIRLFPGCAGKQGASGF